jgi:hypothetical protein
LTAGAPGQRPGRRCGRTAARAPGARAGNGISVAAAWWFNVTAGLAALAVVQWLAPSRCLWLRAMSRIILRLGPNRPSSADPCVVVAGNALSSLVWHTQNRHLHSLCSAAPSAALRIRRSISQFSHLPASASIARWAWPYLQVSNRRARSLCGARTRQPQRTHARHDSRAGVFGAPSLACP